jgi:GntR family transcriptional regulator
LEDTQESQLEFVLDPMSPVPPQTQIVDQIRIWLLMGRLQPGDLLPSIRELERRLEIGRSIIWAAYRELQDAGIITLQQGSRAQVCQIAGSAKRNSQRAQECEELSRKIRQEIHDRGFVLSSFIRYL